MPDGRLLQECCGLAVRLIRLTPELRLSKFRQVTIFLGVVGGIYAVSLVFVTALFARTLLREHAAPLEQAGPLQPAPGESSAQADLRPVTKTA